LHSDGKTVILITHDRDVAAEAERIVSIADGKIASDVRKAG
jgi:macrolide transport system ATP-binding/permease protein